MIHLVHAAVRLGTMVSTVGLPLATTAAPDGPPVVRADISILVIEPLQPGAIGVCVGVRHLIFVLEQVDVLLALASCGMDGLHLELCHCSSSFYR